MSKVSVIGVGDVGATVAYTLQMSGLATEIVLSDVDQARARGHAMDMSHGLFFVPPVAIRAGGYAECAGSQAIVLTAGARQKPGETRLELTRRNAAICRSIVDGLKPHLGEAVLLVVSNPVDVMTHVALERSGLAPGRVFGSGTVLDSARFRYELSRTCRVDARNVHAYVVGEHGDSEVFLWSQVHIAGTPLEAFCEGCGHACVPGDPTASLAAARAAIERSVRESAYHIIESKGFTNYAVSLAILRILGALLRDESSVLTVSTRVEGEYGLRGVCLSVPCVVGRGGVRRIVESRLADGEQAALARSAGVIREAMEGIAAGR
ncbi:MAG TPA: L-lactate dehydrogenase [Planctomycetota bacterium]|nr:L-lactate dehydrogenase [Planctomycetota bacterium]HRR79478.1 L-lactate dehydrogenase [Planctomycetota bacterium]HRT93328.1 L-lactate dehydrogenase [Planctomycetota bacterium]